MEALRVTEYLEIDLDDEVWRCARCARPLGPASRSYKELCLLYDRDPEEINPPLISGPHTFAFDPAWTRIIEFYCPGCGTQIETEYLPPGHPITHDIEIDLVSLKARIAAGELEIHEGRLRPGA